MDCQSFYKADLHVHTPASSCYVSKKSNGDVDEEYFSILAQAVKKDIKVIAITDHNTIKGYRHICQLKHDVEQLYEEYNSSGRPIPQHLRRKASLFSKLTILPGVELEVAYSLHIIVIFHENVDSDNIHSFIEAAGYRAAEMGLEQSKIIPEWDIFRLFKEASKQECLIIDGHTDAAKGIWNEMKGSTRVRILKDPTLAGLCYKNDGQREQIEAVYRQADYKRAVPIAFIKASDAHKSDDVGSSCTWFKLEHFNFSCLKEAFNNPAEFIFTEEPTASKVIAGLLKTENTLLLKEINPETLTQFVRHICAFSNSNGGTILFGASSEKRITGIEIPQGKELNNLKEPLLNIIDNDFKNLPKPRVRFSMHCVRDNRYAISIRVLKSNPLLCTAEDSQIYYFENNKIRVLKAFEIQRLIEEQTLGSISSSIKNDLDEIQHRCNIVENSLLAWPIVSKFELNSKILYPDDIVDTNYDIPKHTSVTKKEKLFYNGTYKGNLLFNDTDPFLPRGRGYCLRYSAPITFVPSIPPSKAEETIYLVKGGAIFYCNRDLPVYSSTLPIIKFHNQARTGYSLIFTFCFLKSTFFLWYCQTKFKSVNIHDSKLYNKIRIPIIGRNIPNKDEIFKLIEDKFKIVLGLEKKYLLATPTTSENDYPLLTDTHNQSISQLCADIDKGIYSLLGLDEKEIAVVEQGMKIHDYFVPAKIPSDIPVC